MTGILALKLVEEFRTDVCDVTYSEEMPFFQPHDFKLKFLQNELRVRDNSFKEA